MATFLIGTIGREDVNQSIMISGGTQTNRSSIYWLDIAEGADGDNALSAWLLKKENQSLRSGEYFALEVESRHVGLQVLG